MYQTTTKHYRKYIFMYGILSILYVLKYYEELENYEECNKIIESIKEQEAKLNITLYTTISNELIDELMMILGDTTMSKKEVINHNKYYSTLIINEIENTLIV